MFSEVHGLLDCIRRGREAEEEPLNIAVLLPVAAGAAIAFQTVLNSMGMRFLGLGGLIGFSGLVTGLLGFTAAALFLARPEVTGRAIVYAVGSGVIGAFVLAAIVLAARMEGLGQTLSLLIASQLLAGLLVDRAGLFGPAVQDLGVFKVLGVVLILIGGVLVVRS
jgi:bacterial/archaeal transporter family-2 protein